MSSVPSIPCHLRLNAEGRETLVTGSGTVLPKWLVTVTCQRASRLAKSTPKLSHCGPGPSTASAHAKLHRQSSIPPQRHSICPSMCEGQCNQIKCHPPRISEAFSREVPLLRNRKQREPQTRSRNPSYRSNLLREAQVLLNLTHICPRALTDIFFQAHNRTKKPRLKINHE